MALLLANDLYLKAAYPGWITGKLSDFSGILVFSLFLFPLLPFGAKKIAAGVAALFVWWKSPYSGFAIDLINETDLIFIGRVVDYSDLIALVVLPVGVCAYHEYIGRQLDLDFRRKVLLLPIVMISVLGITGTSAVHMPRPVEIRATESRSAPSEDQVDAIVDSLLTSRKDECRERINNLRICVIDDVWFSYSADESRVSFEFDQGGSTRSIKKVNRVIELIKAAFAQQADGLIYVEPLIDLQDRRKSTEQ